MRVINTPNDPASVDKLYEVLCQTCHSLIRFARSEAITETTNTTATVLTIVCPTCGSNVEKILNNKIEERVVVEEAYNHQPF